MEKAWVSSLTKVTSKQCWLKSHLRLNPCLGHGSILFNYSLFCTTSDRRQSIIDKVWDSYIINKKEETHPSILPLVGPNVACINSRATASPSVGVSCCWTASMRNPPKFKGSWASSMIRTQDEPVHTFTTHDTDTTNTFKVLIPEHCKDCGFGGMPSQGFPL